VIVHKSWWVAFLLGLGCLLLAGGPGAAGDKKEPGEKKQAGKEDPQKSGGPLLSKEEELKADDEKDTKLTKSPRKVYKITLAEGKAYQIDLKSKDFDAVLRLEDADGKEVAFNDDFAPKSLDSRIVYKAPKGGEYKIIATCLDGATGKFRLTVVEASGADTVSIFKGKAIELKMKDGKARYEGELTRDDPVTQNHYYKLFTVKLEAGKTYRIDHASEDEKFDAYLFLEDPDGNRLAQDDDSGGGLNSRIIYKVNKAGLYRVIATTLPPQQTGKFTLDVVPASAEEEKGAHLAERVNNLAKATPAERKQFLEEFSKHLHAKGAKLSIQDARLAFQVASALEEVDSILARDTYRDYLKAFAAADPQIVKAVESGFGAALKKLELIGKEIAVTGKTIDGKDFDLKDLKGKVVLVDFWATWCGPCLAELPNIQAAYKKYHGKGFEVIGVSLDDTDKVVMNFVTSNKLPWACINTKDSQKLADRYGVTAIPFPVLVDAEGRVVSIRARGPQLDLLLERLLGEKK
jgi:thiol-disulfide isomerase/thioredoxin